MGQIHNELRRTSLSEALRDAVGDSRGPGGLERYGETLSPVIDLWQQPEWAFLRAERLYARGTALAALAGNTNHLQLFNPTDSLTIAVVEELIVTVGTQDQVNVLLGQAALGAAEGTSVPQRDTRFAVDLNQVQSRTLQQAAAAAGRTCLRVRLLADHPVYFRSPYVLTPGNGLHVVTASVNVALAVTWVWRERRALTGEL